VIRRAFKKAASLCGGPAPSTILATLAAAISFWGCGGNTCVAGFTNNGTAAVTASSGNPRPCSFTATHGTIRALILKAAVCENCALGARVEHVFVTIRGVQLRPAVGDSNEAEWLDLAPQLANKPRQIDLLGEALLPRALAENVDVPAEVYRELRLQFSRDSRLGAEQLATESSCGGELRNCVVRADRRVEPLYWLENDPQLTIPLQNDDNDSFIVLPGSETALHLGLELQGTFSFSAAVGWQSQKVLAGRLVFIQRSSFEENKFSTQ
jgi:Domain of unknown function (DUF4382)